MISDRKYRNEHRKNPDLPWASSVYADIPPLRVQNSPH